MNLEERIAAIEVRNQEVEANKRWETSLVRRFSIALITYVAAYFWMRQIGVGDPGLNALIPTGGFLLSTLALPFVRKLWEFFAKN